MPESTIDKELWPNVIFKLVDKTTELVIKIMSAYTISIAFAQLFFFLDHQQIYLAN